MDGFDATAHSLPMESSKGGGKDNARLLSVVVDDDESVRESLPDLLRELGFAVRAFSSALEFLSSDCIDEARCLILDVAMPGMSGPELQQELKRRGKKIPIIFITGQRDESIRTEVLKQGAAGFLLKPFNDDALVAAIKTAMPASSTNNS
jgi:FixJ family two-component response regulator